MKKTIADSGIRIPCKDLQGFFDAWFQMLRPIHHLAGNEIRLLSTMVRMRYELAKKITDRDLLDEYMNTTEMRLKVREACGMKKSNYMVSMGKLRDRGAIVDGKINPRLIPNITGNDYKLLLYFDLKSDEFTDNEQPADNIDSGGTGIAEDVRQEDSGTILEQPVLVDEPD